MLATIPTPNISSLMAKVHMKVKGTAARTKRRAARWTRHVVYSWSQGWDQADKRPEDKFVPSRV